jgi:hypothetical protein
MIYRLFPATAIMEPKRSSLELTPQKIVRLIKDDVTLISLNSRVDI